MKKVCIIGQFPPPVHGLSKALDTMYRGLKKDYELEKIDLTDNKKFLWNLWRICFSKADVFYLTISQSKGGNRRDLCILSAIARKKKKCLVHLHGGYYRELVDKEMSARQREKNYKAMGKLDGAIVLSPSFRKIFEGMLSEEKIFVVPNCIDDEFLLTESEWNEKRSSLSGKAVFHILYLSNFNEEKGYKVVLSLAKEAKRRKDMRFRFDFAGKFFEKEQEEYFHRFVAENCLGDIVAYHGVVSGEQKKQLLFNGDVFLLPTRYPKEGQPISILEAMGAGMAIVSCDHAAIPDMVVDGINGILCRNGEEKDISALYDRMVALSENLPAVADRNYREAVQKYTEKEYLNRLKEIL